LLEVSHLNKQFRLFEKPADRLKEALLRRRCHRLYQALNDVSFGVDAGETLGIIGRNGAGKSTLLKILTGVMLPDTGEVRVQGRITGLLELGTGFDAELTGRANIKANALLLGLTRAQINERLPRIIEFAELGAFIDEPVRTYSSGMVMRLAFATAIHADPACFVVDEALAVGDAHFQQKCMRRIRQFQADGGAIVFVSHDLNAVKMLCDRAIVLEQGEMVDDGAPEDTVNTYNRIIAGTDEDGPESDACDEGGYGSGEARVVSAAGYGTDSDTNSVTCGEELIIDLTVEAAQRVEELTVGLLLRDRFGQDIFGTNSYHLESPFVLDAGEARRLRFRLRADIAAGKYTITVALHSAENHLGDCYHWCDNLLGFEVAGIRGEGFTGICRLPTQLEVETLDRAKEVASQ
jgi:lipopolysaccharide transport system ATP-binding protein